MVYLGWHFTAKPWLLSPKHRSPMALPSALIFYSEPPSLVLTNHSTWECWKPEAYSPPWQGQFFLQAWTLLCWINQCVGCGLQLMESISQNKHTSCAWLLIKMLHEADGIPYYLPILDLEKRLSDPPHLGHGAHQRNGHLPQLFSPGLYARGILPLSYCQGVFSFLTPWMVTLPPYKQH